MSTNPQRAAAFPTLNTDQIARLRAKGRVVRYADGDQVWRLGDSDASCFVVLAGAIDVWIHHGDDRELVTRHAPGEFSGDIDLLSGKPVVVSGTAAGATEVLELDNAAVKTAVIQDSDLSDVLVSAFLTRRALLLRDHQRASLILIGPDGDGGTHQLREFLSRNHLPYSWLQPDADRELAAFLDTTTVASEDFPLIIDSDAHIHQRVRVPELARLTGLLREVGERRYDLAVIGAGPGGLAATVYAASEGLDVITIDRFGPGGQAGTSSKIENYLGFPAGISGSDLAAAAVTQAHKFGARMSVAHEATAIRCEGPGSYRIIVASGEIEARSIVIATGARYRRLGFPGADSFDGRGVYYGATAMEAAACSDREVALVGGGNSAGQAAVFLSQHARHVHMFIRRADLTATMSDYLVQRIAESPAITLHPRTEVSALHGEDRLMGIETSTVGEDEPRAWNIGHLFLFIGATPATEWLAGCLALDDKGFVRTGTDLDEACLSSAAWPLERRPETLETDRPGVYAVGDVRAGSTKRVASAVGEGAMAVHHVHRFLAEQERA